MQSTQSAAGSDIDPRVDSEGYPTNPEWFAAQGINPADLNRELVSTQDQQRQLAELLLNGSESDALNFIRSLRQQVNPNQAQQQPTRPEFPGGSPGEASAPTQQDLASYYEIMQQAAALGNPLDDLEKPAQLWGQIPDTAWRALAGHLIQGNF